MQKSFGSTPALLLSVAALLAVPGAHAQTAAPATTPATPIAHTSARDLQVSGAVTVHNGDMQLGNGSTIVAADEPVAITLNRGGQLRLCPTTSLHLSRDRSIDAPDSTALMLALDRGAVEANYTVTKYSDVLLTPDLRILISGPGVADLRIRVNGKGDTCVDNRGPNAPYITITSQLEGGLYRVQPNQHVTFEHGSLREVVDTETEPCGCPATPAVSVADAGHTSGAPAQPGHVVGGPSSTPADTEFPLALSEGLAAPPPAPTTPVAAPGEVHAQVVVPLAFNGSAPPPEALPVPRTPSASVPSRAAAPAAPAASARTAPARTVPAATARPDSAPPRTPGAAPVNEQTAGDSPALAQRPSAAPARQPASPTRRFFRKVGHFFSRVFGAE